MPPLYVVAFIGFIGGLFAVLFKFALDAMKTWWRKPNLKIYYSHSGADATLLPLVNPKTGVPRLDGVAYYFRLRVRNKGKTAAKSVEIFAASLVGDCTREFLPMNLDMVAW